jgi:hypothetical protein
MGIVPRETHGYIYTQKKWTDKPKGLSVHIPDLNKY